jgi:carboxypeptidase Taq
MKSKKFSNPKVLKLLEKYQYIWAIDHLQKLASWDSEVYMPTDGSNYRGSALGNIAKLTKSLITDKEYLKLIDEVSGEKLNKYEISLLRVINREVKIYKSLPTDFIFEFEKTASNAQLAWRNARKKSDFSLFKSHLSKIIELSIKKANYLGYEDHPYDALLDLYEEGNTVRRLDKYFQEVINSVSELLTIIKVSNQYQSGNPIEKLKYKEDDAIKLNAQVLEKLNINKNKLRLDKSSHPFSEGLSTDDSRITTRYEGFDIARTITSTIHEFGHALYFLQHDEDFNTTPLFTNYSLALHESQSRFFENHIGRSEVFIKSLVPHLHKLGKDYSKFDANEYYNYFNYVQPSLIRVEADEVTYHFHIFIRYEIEKKMIAGELEIDKIPEMWNEMYDKYLNVAPKNDAEGCLQDIHWSMGAIGYFPTYSQGTIFAAQVAKSLNSQTQGLHKLVNSSKGMEEVHKWLKENIHKHGAMYLLDQIAEQISGEPFSTKAWKNYLFEKYGKLYK